MQAMFGAMANAYVAIAPNLTDSATRHPVAEHCSVAEAGRRLPTRERTRLAAPTLGHGSELRPGLTRPAASRRPPWDSAALIPEIAASFVRIEGYALSTLVLGNDVRRRTALLGGLALLALSVFVVGAIMGAWAGVVRIWPVRYSLQLIDGAAKALRQRARVAASCARLRRTPVAIRRQDRGPLPETNAKNRGALHRRTIQRGEQRRAAARHAPPGPRAQLHGRPLLRRGFSSLGLDRLCGRILDLDGGPAHRCGRV